MAPRADMSSFMPVIEEDSELALTGSIEVETLDGAIGEPVFNRILYFPQDCLDDGFELELDPSISLSQEEKEEEGYELPESILEALTSNFMNSCVGCEAFYPKSALRKSTGVRVVPPEPMNRVVSFSSVEVTEFKMTLGDHPSAVSGPPMRLDDSVYSERKLDLDEYESSRAPRRKRKQLRISYKDRKRYLENECGYSTSEVHQAWAEALTIRKQRQETLNRGILLMAFDDVYESACRKVNRVATLGRIT
jgi:hypothetical protein